MRYLKQLIAGARDERQIVAVGGEQLREFKTEAARRSGDQCQFAPGHQPSLAPRGQSRRNLVLVASRGSLKTIAMIGSSFRAGRRERLGEPHLL